MKTYRDLELMGPSSELALAVHNIEVLLTDGWSRDRLAENDIGGDFYVFQRTSTGARPAATLFLARDEGKLHVSNVLPHPPDELTEDDYNSLVLEFHQRFVERAVKSLADIQVRLGPARESLNDWMSEETAELLRTFIAAANPSTGSSHANDQQRWHAFVIAAHQERAGLDTAQLRYWLQDVAGWNEHVVAKLVVEYEQGRALLAEYDRTVQQTS